MTPDFNPGPLRQAWATSPDLREPSEGRGRAVLLPVGAVEQHGPHLPLGVDIWLATAVSLAAAAGEADIRVAEPMPFGVSPHHRAFPGTLSLRPQSFIAVLVDVCACLAADGFLPVIVNGHGGNRGALQVAVAELGAAGIRAAALTYFDLIAADAAAILPDVAHGTGHACALETSLMLHLFAAAVRRDRIPEGGTPPGWPDPHLYAPGGLVVWRGFEEINPTGVIGTPADASPERGAALFDAAVRETRAAIRKLVATYSMRTQP